MTPLHYLDDPPKRERNYSDGELLDFLDQMTGEKERVVFERHRFGHWELHTTANRVDGRLSSRDAITDMARRMRWEPRAERRGFWARIGELMGAG